MPPVFKDAELDERINDIAGQEATRRHAARTIANLSNGPPESHGMEDARFVRFANDDRSISYYATYTAFDVTNIRRQEQLWEILQLGNCGSPIETDRGWLVLTRGVGPMRTFRSRQSCSTSTNPNTCSPDHRCRSSHKPRAAETAA